MSPRPHEASCVYREENGDTRLEIWDEGDRRSLWFDDNILQSEIDLRDPKRLPNPVNRAMLAPLLFRRSTKQVLLAGCGGGAVARWFHAQAPEVLGIAVELSPRVAGIARAYFDFPSIDSNWQLRIGDIRDQLTRTRSTYDYLLVDLEERQHTPEWTTAAPFLRSCRMHLSRSGTLVINLISPSVGDAADALFRIRQIFDAGIYLLDNPAHENLLVLASGDPPSQIPQPAVLKARSQQWGLDFTAMAKRLRWVPPPVP